MTDGIHFSISAAGDTAALGRFVALYVRAFTGLAKVRRT